MGLAESPSELPDGAGEARKTFANDVFKIEICGPDQEHLSVIDVPGIFRKTTPGVTTKADMAMGEPWSHLTWRIQGLRFWR